MLNGRVALVTGASRGLGRETARVLVDAGASLALVARSSAELEQAADLLARQCHSPGQRVIALPTDLREPVTAAVTVDAAVRELGRLDVLVNNAGMTGPIGSLDLNDWDKWTQTVTVDLLAPVALMRAAIAVMRHQGWGKIVNLSGGGASGPRPNFSAYSAAKAALVRMTETLAEELKHTGIDVNAVAPGALNTRMLDDVLLAGPERVGKKAYREAVDQKAQGGAPTGRAAELILFLASPASDGITGRLISAVWDPWESLAQKRAELSSSDIYTLRRIRPEDRGKDWKRRDVGAEPARAALSATVPSVTIAGLWHLGTVLAACLASRGIPTLAYDSNRELVDSLSCGHPPVFEPGLEMLLRDSLKEGTLKVTSDPRAVVETPILWAGWDTSVHDDDRADVESVIEELVKLFPHVRDDCLILVSSQLPVGSTKRLEEAYAVARPSGHASFAYIPENLRLGSAIEAFTQPERVVAGVRSERDAEVIRQLLAPFTSAVEIMRVESAELTKHALNAFLATSVAFINEMARVAEVVGADAHEVERGLKSDVRIGGRAYLHPGSAYAGGTLARDIEYLIDRSHVLGRSLPLCRGVRESNDVHKNWTYDTLSRLLGTFTGSRIAVLGLTYKPGTDTLRRSASIELCERLATAGATVIAYDPVIASLPVHLTQAFVLAASARDALREAQAAVVATEWPAFRSLSSDDFLDGRLSAIVVDPGGFLAASLEGDTRMRYARVGTVL